MKARDRQNYSAGYGQSCVAALLVLGPPPRGIWHEETDRYFQELRDWWLSTQNPGTHQKQAYKFQRFFHAWYKDQKQRGRNDGIV